ncbi:hypothetical protein MNBD_GAMMA01-193 [hydrothermal vent metagenome]|uniref:Uncharacterized protein n=1 Tax=hydrothermal vent metagenome TaxID=652676 RepID=A0A3B0V808_9ZZZZ
MVRVVIRLFIIIFGLIDVLYILWVLVNDIINHKIPFYSTLVESLKVGDSYSNGSILFSFLSIFSFFLIISICFSGPLLIMKKKAGIYMSFFQFPFRVITFIPPTFFFVSPLLFTLFESITLSLIIILAFEVLKFYIEINWLKSLRKSRECG